MDMISQYVGEYFSKEWVQKNVLMLDDDTIESIEKQISGEQEPEEGEPQPDSQNNGDEQ
jgi:hypothetical protein